MLYQATCVAIDGRGVLITGAPGSGKSSLALALIDRGAVLVGDDGVQLVAEGTRLTASPAPATAGLIEVRNVGLAPLGWVGGVQVALALQLDHAAPRFIERAERLVLAGCTVPVVRLWPDSPVLALRAEMALAIHGL